MKKIYFFCLFFYCDFLYSQQIDTAWLTNNIAYGSRHKRIKIDSTFFLPYSGDTATKDKGMMKYLNGRIYASNGTYWQGVSFADEQPEINVKYFGAVGDGVVNDRPALMAAIAYMDNLGGGTIYIPHDMVCVVDTGIYLKSNINIHIDGTLQNRQRVVNEDVDQAFRFTPIFMGNYLPSTYDTTNQKYNICDSIIGSKIYLKNISDTALYRKDTMIILRSMEAWYNGRNSFKPYYQTFALVDSVVGNIVYCDNDLGLNLERPALLGRVGNIKSSATKKVDGFGVPYYGVHHCNIYGSGYIISEGSPMTLMTTAYIVNIEGLFVRGLEALSGNMMVKWNVNNMRFRVNKQLLELSVNTNKSSFTNWVGEFVDFEYKVNRQPIIRVGENSYNNLISNLKIVSISGGGDSLSAIAIDDGWDNTIQGIYLVADSLTNGVEVRTGRDSAHVYNNVIKDCEFHFLKPNILKYFIDMNKEELTGSSVILRNNKFENLRFYGTPKNNAIKFDGDGNSISNCYFQNGSYVKLSTVFTSGLLMNSYLADPSKKIVGINTLGNYNTSVLYPITYQSSSNNSFGSSSLSALTGGDFNTAIGTGTLNAITNSNNNTAVGYNALNNATDGPNTAIGSQALFNNSTGKFNTAVGYQALLNNTVGNKNTAVGRGVLSEATGIGNIGIGNNAGDNITTGSNNIVIGTDITLQTITASNYLNLGNIIYGTGVNTSGSTVSGGSIGINQRSPAYTFDVTGTGRFTESLKIGAYTLPSIDGAAGQYLSTDGVGAVSWNSASSPYLFSEVSVSNFTTTATTATTITGLTIAVEANKKYRVSVILNTGSSGTNGIVFGFNGPSGSAVLSGLIKGVNTSASTARVQKVAIMNSLNSNGFQNYNGTNGAVEITAIIAISTTSGNLNFQCASVNGAETSTIYIGSTMVAEKLN